MDPEYTALVKEYVETSLFIIKVLMATLCVAMAGITCLAWNNYSLTKKLKSLERKK